MAEGFSPFGSWESFVATANIKGFAWKNLLGQDKPGTFTPSLGGNATYAAQIGTFNQFGRQVLFNLRLAVTSIGTGSPTVISGLPFVAAEYDFICAARGTGLAIAVVYLAGVVLNGTDTLRLVSRTAANIDDAFNSVIGDGAVIQVTGMFHF